MGRDGIKLPESVSDYGRDTIGVVSGEVGRTTAALAAGDVGEKGRGLK